jgi:hypothetical protein
VIDPQVVYFADAANVWYYGLKEDVLYVYDASTEEFDQLGAVEVELSKLLEEWEASASSSEQAD